VISSRQWTAPKLSASDSEYEDELSSLIRQYDVGKTLDLTVLRDKAELKVPVELAARHACSAR